jgi:hypothetical protein
MTGPEARERILPFGVPLKPQMRSVFMMVSNILREQSLQMAFIQRNNVVQQVGIQTPSQDGMLHPSRMRIQSQGPMRRKLAVTHCCRTEPHLWE